MSDLNNATYIRFENISINITDFVASGNFASLRENVKYCKTKNYALMVKTQDFQNNFTKDLTYTDENSYKFLHNSNLFGGELLLSNIGASIGKVFIVPKLDIKMTLAPNSIMVKMSSNILTKWLYFYFKSNYGQKILFSISSGSAMKKFNKTDLRNVIIPIYSLQYMTKAIERIEEIENSLNLINSKIYDVELTKTYIKHKLLETIFSDSSSYKSYYENRSLTTLQEYINKSDIGDGDWVLSENMDNKGNYSIIQLKHIGNGEYLDKPYCKINEIFFNSNKCTEIKEGYILINRLVANKMNVCILPKLDNKTITAVDVCWIAPSKKYNSKYLMYYILSPCFQNEVMKRVSGSTRKRISKKNLINIPMNIHTIDIQNEIVKYLDDTFKIIDNI